MCLMPSIWCSFKSLDTWLWTKIFLFVVGSMSKTNSVEAESNWLARKISFSFRWRIDCFSALFAWIKENYSISFSIFVDWTKPFVSLYPTHHIAKFDVMNFEVDFSACHQNCGNVSLKVQSHCRYRNRNLLQTILAFKKGHQHCQNMQ